MTELPYRTVIMVRCDEKLYQTVFRSWLVGVHSKNKNKRKMQREWYEKREIKHTKTNSTLLCATRDGSKRKISKRCIEIIALTETGCREVIMPVLHFKIGHDRRQPRATCFISIPSELHDWQTLLAPTSSSMNQRMSSSGCPLERRSRPRPKPMPPPRPQPPFPWGLQWRPTSSSFWIRKQISSSTPNWGSSTDAWSEDSVSPTSFLPRTPGERRWRGQCWWV